MNIYKIHWRNTQYKQKKLYKYTPQKISLNPKSQPNQICIQLLCNRLVCCFQARIRATAYFSFLHPGATGYGGEFQFFLSGLPYFMFDNFFFSILRTRLGTILLCHNNTEWSCKNLMLSNLLCLSLKGLLFERNLFISLRFIYQQQNNMLATFCF